LDFFKRVNEAHGHVVGDQILVTLVMTIMHELSGTGRLGRLGDEEFGLLLPETAQGAALRIAERVRQRICDSSDLTKISEHPLTVSVGVCDLQTSDRDFDDLLRRTDKALERAKSEGRNRVVAG
jgi:diguanylate cyclase (GGDEF)-like protein